MIFADLAAGDAVFVDANTLVYHFGPHPTFGPACQQLTHRIENQDLFGFTSTHTLAEVAHQLMIAEALTLPSWSPGKVKKRLHQQPAALQQLTLFRTAVETVLQSQIKVLTIAPSLLGAATTVRAVCRCLAYTNPKRERESSLTLRVRVTNPTTNRSSQQFGLLTNDALTVAIMQANGLTRIASHDTDFDRVPGITRYSPA
jgi:predicted nucleic acid-binding protein